MIRRKLEAILETEDRHLSQLHDIVVKAIEEENLLSKKLFEFEDTRPGFGSRVADKVASFGGSWRFIITFLAFMMLWMGLNLFLLSRPFDPFPFILLNLFLSAIAAVQAPVIMMSQNRKEEKDRQRAVNDYMVNLKAEIEIRHLHQKIDLLISEQMQTLFETQRLQMEVLDDIQKKLEAGG